METKFEKYQKQLLDQAQHIYYEHPISEATQKAFFSNPRHSFVPRYRQWGAKEWNTVSEDNLESHLARLYNDGALVLHGDDDDNLQSTISQPSFVLRMLDMLQLAPGQKVFELGAGSGWNAALMGHLVGPEGQVHSLEIIPEVARLAAQNIQRLGIKNVSIIESDGGEGYAAGAPYDRAIFTAGTYDFPHYFFEQIKNGGLFLAIIKSVGGLDTLFLLRKTTDHFESLESMSCGFVPMTGKYRITGLDPVILETWSDWSELKLPEIAQQKFWWGGKGKNEFVWRTLGIRSFLGITEPFFRTFKTQKTDKQSHEEGYFGLWDKSDLSLVIAKDDMLVSYGNIKAEQRLMQDVRSWVDLGMPSAASFDLQIYPIDISLSPGENQWIVKRSEAQFLWSLKI